MAKIINEPSHTFNEYLLIPGYTPITCRSEKVSLRTPLVKFRKGQEEPAISMNIPMVSAIMQSVSGDRLAVALATEGGVSFIYGSQSIEDEAAMVRRAKSYKAGFVRSDSNLSPDATLQDVLALKARTGHSTIAVTADGTAEGRLVGVVTSRDYRVTRMEPDTKVSSFMTPFEKLIWAPEGTTLKEANDIIWDHKLNSLPILSEDGRLCYFVFRKDYESHKQNPNELLDAHKRYVVGAGINTRDYEKRIPALLEAGADVLCIDSSEGFTDWQRFVLTWVREHYGDRVKIGAGNVVDAAGFRFLAECGADFVKVGIGGGSICITRETKGIGRGQATALIDVCAERDRYFEETGIYVPVCSDGGIVYDHHITLALAMGAQRVLGRGLRPGPQLAALRHGRRQEAELRGGRGFLRALRRLSQGQRGPDPEQGAPRHVQLRLPHHPGVPGEGGADPGLRHHHRGGRRPRRDPEGHLPRHQVIVMGSDSDLPVIQKATALLRELEIPFEVHVYSAHRTPLQAHDFAASAREKGFGVLIAAAGMAAHLAGAVAANTTLPVIGIPCKGPALEGLDALLSTVQMPSGIPVATVGIGGGANAALLAAQILAVEDAALAERLAAKRAADTAAVLQKDAGIAERL